MLRRSSSTSPRPRSAGAGTHARTRTCVNHAGTIKVGPGVALGGKAASLRRYSSDAMMVPVVVRPRPIWQLNTNAAVPRLGHSLRSSGTQAGTQRCLEAAEEGSKEGGREADARLGASLACARCRSGHHARMPPASAAGRACRPPSLHGWAHPKAPRWACLQAPRSTPRVCPPARGTAQRSAPADEHVKVRILGRLLVRDGDAQVVDVIAVSCRAGAGQARPAGA